MAIRILIADDHSMVRKGIRTLLEDETDLQIVGEAADGDEALELLPQLHPDVLLLDITMPRLSGIEVSRMTAQQFPQVKVLIFSMHNHPDYILSAVQYGASGYLLKDTDDEEILQAIRTVAAGDLYYPPSASSVIIKQLVLAKPKARVDVATNPSIWNKLTSREAQVLGCLTEGLSNQEIARRFDTSPNTVANQRASILRKAGVKNTAELISLALKEPPGA
ncbi:DNA-binding response regulator [Siphonobacter sp. BAB-5405]|uniref:response regulator transcription factor n=1 Tax=Siphonobacter sp. BAB-5405 TaxID=1864825 RepID=UPI000C7FDE67|nr:response regulator transcription factor [Siphonobacter sp. BAB-5405]PMD91446.1 DNA-binding response regulator [Siphonobacter sp. BAB-5405]